MILPISTLPVAETKQLRAAWEDEPSGTFPETEPASPEARRESAPESPEPVAPVQNRVQENVLLALFRREENPESGQTGRASRPVTREEWNSIDFRNPYTFLDNLETNSFIACFQDPNSTMEHPTLFVWTRSKDGQEVLRVDLDKVDPKNATRAEIYALINHLYKGEDYMCAMATFTYVENECKDLTNYGEVDFSARAISVPSSAQRLNYEKIFQDAAKRIGEFLKRQADEGLQKTYDTLLDMVDRFKGYPKDGTSTQTSTQPIRDHLTEDLSDVSPAKQELHQQSSTLSGSQTFATQ